MDEFVKRLARLPADRRAQLLALLMASGGGTVDAVPTRREREATGPLSAAQEALWPAAQLARDQPTHHTPVCFRIAGDLDVEALRGALASVVARHETLRTAVSDGPDGPVRTVAEQVTVDLPLIDVAGPDLASRRDTAQRCVRELGRKVFALDRAPLWRAALLRVAPTEHLFLFVVHHLIFDNWSLRLFCDELSQRYRELHAGTGTEGKPATPTPTSHPTPAPAPADDLRLDYGDYVLWERERLCDDRLASLADFWRGRFAGAPVLDFPTDRPRPPEQSPRGALVNRSIRLGGSEMLAGLARALRTTPVVVTTAAFLALLHRYSGAEDLVIGMPSTNREYAGVGSVVGRFATLLALRGDVSGDPSFRELVERTREVVREARAHRPLPFGRMVGAVRPPADASRPPDFQVVFAYQDRPTGLDLPGLDVSWSEVDTGTVRFDMSWQVLDSPDGPRLTVRYRTDLFEESTIRDLVRRYGAVLRAVTADPELRLSHIPLLDDAERAALLANWNGPTRPVRETTLPELFAEQVARRPDAVALVVAGTQLTYAELDRQANQLAHVLRELGAGPDRLVALCLPRQAELVVAMLATLKAGAAYVPLAPGQPIGRLGAVVADAAPVAVVTTGEVGGVADALGTLGVPVVRLDTDRDRLASAAQQAPAPTAGPTDLAYVTYTSGSTDTPKGVLIEHRAAVNFINAVTGLLALTEVDRVLGYAAATFDVSVFEIFSALLTGGRLYLATEEERHDVGRLQALLERNGITVTDLPPPVMARLEPERLPALRIVLVGLEVFPGELVNRWNPGRRFVNGYGPAECTVTMTIHECPGHWTGPPPIGLPIANHVAHVLDAAGQPVPAGAPGELVIGGVGLARGYLNAPELTAERFYPDPFGTAPGGRLYRTGDLVRRRTDGALVFLGRIDQQVRIRGLRIESVLSRLPEIAQVAVEPTRDERGEQHLVCYVVGRDAEPDPVRLRAWLARHLPPYLVPEHYVALAELPLHSSGKVDRRRLPVPRISGGRPDGPARYRDEMERSLAEEIVGPVLGLSVVDPERSFFDLGGHSLAVARVLSRIRSRYSIEIGLADLFHTPTLRGLGELVRHRPSTTVDDELMATLRSMAGDPAALLAGCAEPGR